MNPLTVLLGLLLLLGACSPARETRAHIVFVPKMVDDANSFWLSVRTGALSAAEDFNVDVEVTGPRDETLVDEQIRIVEDAVRRRPSAIVLAADDFLRLIPAVQSARAAGIPVVTVDSSIATDDASAKIGTDNLQLGRIVGSALARLVPPGSTVGLLSYIKASSTARDREQGLTEALKGTFNLLPPAYNEADEKVAYRQAKALLASQPDLSGLVALNLPTTLGAIRALRESGLQDRVVLVGVDASFEVLKALEEGVLKAVLVQQPFNMGYLGVEAAVTIAAGRPWPASVDTGAIEINKASLFLAQNEKLLFPVSVLNSPHPVPNP